jgi:methylmalonyl-CoA decarboxylase subunit alpha
MSDAPGGKFDPTMPPRGADAPGAVPPLRGLTGPEKTARLRAMEQAIERGGGQKAVEKLHARGKHTGQERVDMLVDPGSFSELDKWAGSHRGVMRGNTITGHARIDGRPVVVISNMSESKSGAWYGESVFKMIRAQEYSYRMRVPLIVLVDSASAYLPEQEDIHSGSRHGGKVFHYLARHSGLFPQVAGLFGWSVAGGAYVPGLCDFVPMVKESAMFLAGPKLVQAAIGEKVSVADLGGPTVHCRQSGVGDLECADDAACLAAIRRYLSYLPTSYKQRPPRVETTDDPERATPEVADLIPSEPRKTYDVRRVLGAVSDADSVFELRPHFGASLVVAFARLDGKPTGFVASQPKHLGGVIDAAASDKAAWFISICDAFHIPLVFLQDVPGFMVGTKAERGGIIHAGARLIQAMARATVPRITVVLRKAYGAGQYALCGPAFGPTRIFGMPLAETGTMAPEQLADVVYGEAIAAAEGERRLAIEAERDRVVGHHAITLGADYAASKGWYDGIVHPEDLRRTLCRELRSAETLEDDLPEGRRAISLT